MDLSGWKQGHSDRGRRKRLLIGTVSGIGTCALACAVLVAASGAQAQLPPEEEPVEVKLVTAVETPPEPEPAPVVDNPVPAAPAAGPRAPRLRPLAAPTAVPTEKPAESDAPAQAAGNDDDAYADLDAHRGGASPGIAAPTAVQRPVEPPKPVAPPRAAGPVQLPENASPPEVVARVEPVYPEEARRQGVEAVIVVKFAVSESGQVLGAQIVKGHPLFDDTVLRAVSRWRYKPAMAEGRAIAVYRIVRFPFKLKT